MGKLIILIVALSAAWGFFCGMLFFTHNIWANAAGYPLALGVGITSGLLKLRINRLPREVE